ncbi:MAG: FecR domain-containing protein [Gemmatimonadetes bacterium]|nr:FecR domain-containing protein [Gemmatimonadota bacterium]
MEELIVRSLQGRATAAEQQQLREWRGAAAVNESAYRAIAELWEATGSLEGDAEPRVPQPVAGDLLRRAREGPIAIPIFAAARYSGGRRSRKWVAGAAAAAALVLLGVGIAEYGAKATFTARSFATGPGELVTVQLEDGSVVRLGPQSRLSLIRHKDERRVTLNGRAFFGVAHDPRQPFIVETSIGEAVALGTRFEVRADSEELRVVVVDGRVALTAAGDRVEIGGGEMSQVSGSGIAVSAVENVYSLLDWMGGALVFQATPLAAVATEIERRYGIDITIEDSSLLDLTVTASFTGQQPDQVVGILCRVLSTACDLEAGEARIGVRNGIQ